MSENWDFYPALVDHKPASIFVDMGISEKAPLKAFENFGYLRIQMQNPRQDGLSSQEDYDDLSVFEDAILPVITVKNLAVYVGRNTSDGKRDFYFYTDNKQNFDAAVKQAMTSFPQYKFETGSHVDENWEMYFGFLYPDDRNMQLIYNRHVCEQLTEHEDNLNLPRPIDHTAFFPDKKYAQEFVDYASKDGFEIVSVAKDGFFSGRRCVEFNRVDIPSNIDDIVLSVFDKVVELQGEYDGWGCPIVAD